MGKNGLMAGSFDAGRTQRKAAVVGFIIAVVVLVAGIAAALTHDDSPVERTSTGLTTSTTTTKSSSSSSGSSTSTTKPVSSTTGSSTTLGTLPGSGTTTTTRPGATTTTTAPFTNADAEKTANGLFSAYRTRDQQTASRYATPDVVNGLFAQPFFEAKFGGCSQDGELFSCRFADATSGATYDFTVQSDPQSGNPLVVIFHYSGPADTTTTSTPG